MTSISKTGISERIRIGIFGRVNAGKSSLLNYLTGTDTAIVSSQEGTTTDPIKKTMEITGFGPVVFVDTAGLADYTSLGDKRVRKSKIEFSKVDIVVYCLSRGDDLGLLKSLDKPVIYIAMKQDLEEGEKLLDEFKDLDPIAIDIRSLKSRDKLFNTFKKIYKKDELSLTKNLVSKNDIVVLVMPQDEAAPKDRIIKPQVMTIREIIDKGASAVCTDLENLENTLASLKKVDLVITDSKVFKEVSELVKDPIKLTSFSILFASFKGDLDYFVKSAQILDENPKNILIAEACTHPPIKEDIGTVKIPRMLREKYPGINIDFTRGDKPIDYKKYDLIIMCGSCMFNRAFVLDRVKKAKEFDTPITNYGVAIGKLKGILEKVSLPEKI